MSAELLQAILPHLREPKLQEDGRYRAWCPFHPDGQGKAPHAPDLYVDEKGFICHACGQHGSLRDLAERLGVEVSRQNRQQTALDALRERGIKDETLRTFGIRASDRGEAFIPIPGENGAEIAVRIRSADGKKFWPRRENDPRRADILTDWQRLKVSNTAFLVAGETDFLVAWQAGYPAATFLYGEGNVRREAVEKLAAVVKRIDVFYDADESGPKGAEKVRQAFEAKGVEVLVKQLPTPDPNIKDICDLYRYLGFDDNRLREALDAAENVEILNISPSPRFLLTQLSDLLREPEEEVDFVWESTLPAAGLSLVAAKPKVGKSTFARNLSLAISRGELFLGRVTVQGAVVYLAIEEKRGEVARHFRMMEAKDEPVFIHVGMAPEEALEALRAAIVENDAVLAVVDPLLRFVRVKDANDYAEVTRALDPLLHLARETGCHVLTIHHAGKLERGGGDSILGSTALFGGVDTAVILTRREEGRTVETIQRYGLDIPKTVLAFDTLTGLLSSAGTVEEADMKRAETRILEALGDTEMTEEEIKKEVGGNTGLTGKALRRLLADGQIERQGEGKKGSPFVYKILVSRFPYIEKQENEKNEKKEEALVRPLASEEWGEV